MFVPIPHVATNPIGYAFMSARCAVNLRAAAPSADRSTSARTARRVAARFMAEAVDALENALAALLPVSTVLLWTGGGRLRPGNYAVRMTGARIVETDKGPQIRIQIEPAA